MIILGYIGICGKDLYVLFDGSLFVSLTSYLESTCFSNACSSTYIGIYV